MSELAPNHDPVLSELNEFDALWTTNMTQKKKKWHDGKLKFYLFNRRAVLYDEHMNFVADYFHNRAVVEEDDELVFERVLVRVLSKKSIVVRDIGPALAGIRNEARGSSSRRNGVSTPLTGSTRRVITPNHFATAPSNTSGIMATNDTFGNVPPPQMNLSSPLSHSTPVSQSMEAPLKSGPSLGLKRRRVMNHFPIAKPLAPPTTPIRPISVTVNYNRGNITEIRERSDPIPNKSDESISQPLPSGSPTIPNTSSTPAARTTSIKRNSRSLISLQPQNTPSARRSNPLLCRVVPSIDDLRFGTSQLDNSQSNIPKELQYQLSQDIDNLREEDFLSEHTDSENDQEMAAEIENILSQSNVSSTSRLVRETSTNSNTTATTTSKSTVPSTVSVTETGPWSKEALDLFAWRPPGLD